MKHKIGGGFCLVFVIAIFPALSFGAQIFVPSQYSSIQLAINAASANDEIIVAPGNYVGGINFLGKAILVRSVDPQNWDTIKTTIINGNNSSPDVTFNTGETNQTILRGFTLVNGRGQLANSGYYCGGGIYCENSSPVIQNCFITGNGSSSQPQYGGGVAVLGNSSPILLNCIVTNNFAGSQGGGFYCISSGSPRILSCTFSRNTLATSSFGFEVYCGNSQVGNSQVAIENTIIYTLNETYNRKGLMHNRYDLVKYNCISSAYTSGSLVNIESFGGNISKKPCFVSSAYSYVFPNTYVFGDYHLYPSSPCINKGDPNYSETGLVDIDNQPRIMNGRIDIGADEFQDYIKVLKPAAGEVWAAGSTKAICWESLHDKNPVDIFYSIDNGLNWIVAAQGVDNNGRYLWTIPEGANSAQCLVRIAPSAAAPDLRIVPSGIFTLHPITLGQAVNAYWPTLNKDRFHRGFSDVAGPQTGCVKWEYSTSSPVYGSAVIGDANNIYVASGNRLVKLSPNGSEQWSYTGPDEFLSSPAIGLDGAIHIGSQNGCLYSIDINGNLRWTHQTNDAIYATPTIAPDGSVYAGSMDGTLYALAPDGSCLWQFTPDNKGMILSSPAIGQNGEVYVGFLYNPELYALDGQTGTVLWSRHFGWNWSNQLPQYEEISGSLFTSPVIGNDGEIYIATLNDSTFYALNPGDGSTAWSLPLNQIYPNRGYANNIQGMSDSWSEPVIGVDGTIYVCMDDMYIWAIRPGGTVAWIRQLGLSGSFTLAASANDLIYAACDEGLIYVLDSNGSLVSCFKGNQRLSHPVLSPDGMLYIGDSSGKLWAIGSGDCQIGDHLLYPAGDQNLDIQVNLTDFEIISNNWLTDTSSQQWVFEESDLNRDYLTNLEDLMIFCNNWLYSE